MKYVVDTTNTIGCNEPRSEAETQSVGAPANEIEITPEMIEIGISLLRLYGAYIDSAEELVRTIFEEMSKVQGTS